MRISDIRTSSDDGGGEHIDYSILFAGLDAIRIVREGYQEQIAAALAPALESNRLVIQKMMESISPDITAMRQGMLAAFLAPEFQAFMRGLNSLDLRQVQDAIREATELTEEVDDLDLPDLAEDVLPADRQERLALLRERIFGTLQKLAAAELILREKVKSGNDAVETYTKGIQNLTYALLAIWVFLDRIV